MLKYSPSQSIDLDPCCYQHEVFDDVGCDLRHETIYRLVISAFNSTGYLGRLEDQSMGDGKCL
jgi:hypothetical protein